MEVHAIWSRIDQLEQLILSQAKEIDLLRRILNATQLALQNYQQGNQLEYPDSAKSPNGLTLATTASRHHRQQHNQLSITPPTAITNSTSHSNLFKLPQQQQKQQPEQPTLYKSYLMNPFVHPSIAIPPIANRVVLQSETSNSLISDNFSPSIGGATRRTTTQPNGIGTTRTLPANTRWSTGPSLLGTLQDPDREMDEEPRKRNNRFSLVELLTCFCPCFSMC